MAEPRLGVLQLDDVTEDNGRGGDVLTCSREDWGLLSYDLVLDL